MGELHPFWLSWTTRTHWGGFDLDSPWWITGYVGDNGTFIVAAIWAEDEWEAKHRIKQAYDKPRQHLAFRFCEQKPDDWTPFSDRFERADWMKWRRVDAD